MATQHITALAWLMGMLASPEALALHGNLTGMNGWGFIGPLVVVLLLHALNAVSLGGSVEIRDLRKTLGPYGAVFLLLAARPAVAVCLATAVLVSAGFVFNEVFLYWFPNFGFAALMLVTLFVLNLAGPWAASRAQTLFTFTALIGLAVLALTGLSAGGATPPAFHWGPAFLNWRSWGLAAIAFVGYDLLRDSAPKLNRSERVGLTTIGLTAAGLVLGAWNAATLLHVEPSRLAETSIPHILAAKAIMGPAGRIVIGIVTIAGAAAAVNVLFQAVGRMTATMAEHGLLPAACAKPLLPLVAMTGATGLGMASGFAGSDLLDVSLRAGLILWLVAMGLAHLAPLLIGPSPACGSRAAPRIGHTVRHLSILVTMPALASTLVWTDDDPSTLVRAILILAAIAAGLAAVGLVTALPTVRKTAANHDGFVKSKISDGFVKSSRSRLANPEE